MFVIRTALTQLAVSPVAAMQDLSLTLMDRPAMVSECITLCIMETVHNYCIDVDECLMDNGGCVHVCNNEMGTFSCSCTTGYELQPDGITCTGENINYRRSGNFRV